MAKDPDPTKDPAFQKAVQALLRAPPQPHKSGGKPKARRKHSPNKGEKQK